MTVITLLPLHCNTWNHLTVCKQMTDITLLPLHSNTWDYLTEYKIMSQGSFKSRSTK